MSGTKSEDPFHKLFQGENRRRISELFFVKIHAWLPHVNFLFVLCLLQHAVHESALLSHDISAVGKSFN